jgi:hypothetical protein
MLAMVSVNKYYPNRRHTSGEDAEVLAFTKISGRSKLQCEDTNNLK